MSGDARCSSRRERQRRRYGPFRALFGVSFTVGEGEAVALLGTERRRQDHGRPGVHRASFAPTAGSGASSTATT